MLFIVIQTTFDDLDRRECTARRVKIERNVINVMYVDSFVIDDFDANDAHIVENKTHESMIHVQSIVDVKADFHIFNVFVQQMKIDIKRIVKRRHADVVSRFLNCQ